MIICLIGLGLIILGLMFYLFVLLAEKKYNYYDNKVCEFYERDPILSSRYKKKRKFWEKFDLRYNWPIGACFGMGATIIVAIIFLLFAGSKSDGKRDYEEYLLVKEIIEYCVDNDITIDNSMLEKTIRLNKEIANYKQDKQNPWLNWFIYNDICNVEEIDLDYFK